MVRRKYYKKSTNIVRMKFQSFMDIQTTDASMQIITISAGGPEILRRLAPQFSAYKYYKIGNISAKLVPATTLPVDPSGLSINAGASGVNPWDQLSPGMMRITNGEDIFEDLTGLSTDEQDAIYKTMLLDPRWYKWMLQTGVKRHATPRFWQVGQLHQDKWPGVITNLPFFDESGDFAGTAHEYQRSVAPGTVQQFFQTGGSSPYGFFQTGHSGVLGWLPTDGLSPILGADGVVNKTPLIASPPEIEVFKIILPRAILTKYAYRLYISETVLFREPIVNFGVVAPDNLVYRPLDVFHAPSQPGPRLPGTPEYNLFPNDVFTGGNYGDD